MIVVDCGQNVEVEDLPSWRNPHRRGWQVLTSPDVERSTEAWWEDRHRCAGVKIMTNTRWEKKRNDWGEIFTACWNYTRKQIGQTVTEKILSIHFYSFVFQQTHNTSIWVNFSFHFSLIEALKCRSKVENTSPFPGVVLSKDGDHPLHWAQDGTMDDDWSSFVVTVLPVRKKMKGKYKSKHILGYCNICLCLFVWQCKRPNLAQ